jgi:molybdopterin-guanine dinucleotide biosynthesis protein A
MIESVECANAFIFILAGGKSARMGTDKAFLTLHGKTLLERALGVAASVAEEVYIVGDRQKFLQFGQVVEDVFAGCGPLGGIHTALRQTAADLNLMLAVDIPFVDARFLKYLIVQASQSDAVVTVPWAGGNWQPLCAVYRREFASAAESALQKGMNKIDPLFAQVKTRAIGEEELSQSGFGVSMFRNLNTPEEFEGAEKEIVRGDG